ncbi:MAG: hypothetical protein AAF479_11955 [Pseudomonadota bacterium]
MAANDMIRWALVTVLVLLGGCSSGEETELVLFETPKTAVSYTIELSGLPDQEMVDSAEGALAVYREQERGAQSIAFLKRRAQGDSKLLQRILRSGGYYNGSVEVKVTEEPEVEAEPDAEPDAEAEPDSEVDKEKTAVV